MPLPKELFVETSFWFAAMVATDVNHERAGEVLEEAAVGASRFHRTPRKPGIGAEGNTSYRRLSCLECKMGASFADALGVSEQVIKTRLHRARLALRENVGGYLAI